MKKEDNFIFELLHRDGCYKPNDRLEVKFGDYNYEIDLSGRVYFKTKYLLYRLSNYDISFQKDGLWGLLNNNGKIMVQPEYKCIYNALIGGKCYTFCKADKYKWGLIERNGNIKVPAIFDGGLEYLGKNYYVGVIGDNDGVVNDNGTQILPFEYYDSSIFFWNRKKNYFACCKGDKYGVVNGNREIIIPFEYDYIETCFNKGKYKDCSIARKNGLEGIINEKNETIVPFKYAEIRKLSNETFFVSKNGVTYFVTDNDFNKICDVDYNFVIGEEDDNEKYFIACVEPSGNSGLIDKYGNIKIDLKYNDLKIIDGTQENNELYLYAQNNQGKYGIIDVDENIIVPFEYDCYYANKIDNDYTKVMVKNGKYGVINIKTNEVLVDFIYDDIYPLYGRETTLAKYNGKWGVISKQGESIKYDLTKAKEVMV